MGNKIIKKKYVFLGDTNSINIEIVEKSFYKLKRKNITYIIIGNKKELIRYLVKIKSKIQVYEIIDPFNFDNCKNNFLNIFNVENISTKKYKNLLNQIKIANYLSNKSKIDLVTMPINKSIFKKEIKFIGMTEYLGKLNKTKTMMIMYGEKFSIIPYTTHINPKNIHSFIKLKYLNQFIKLLLKFLKRKDYAMDFKYIKFICYNPHCGEESTLGEEDVIITNIIKRNKMILGPFPADSAFASLKKKTLYISTYHDQALIPFKLLNRKGLNITLGLKYKRLSPAHGTASDKKYKSISDNTSYLECMQI
tara:strand:+ start:564 stop:1484 length:921 start_codon:yes stop_codon:yes gene_type:complete